MSGVHRAGVVHRDFRPSNLLGELQSDGLSQGPTVRGLRSFDR